MRRCQTSAWTRTASCQRWADAGALHVLNYASAVHGGQLLVLLVDEVQDMSLHGNGTPLPVKRLVTGKPERHAGTAIKIAVHK